MNYLQAELYELLKKDSSIFEFIQSGSLDGIWYWDLEKPDQEWMSDRFWEVLGIDPSSKKHLASEWKDLIFQEDLEVALTNFEKHCHDPHHPYDQLVRYRHANGSTVWIRCRGIAIRDQEGKPLRMLGAHNDVTQVVLAEQLRKNNDDLTLFAKGATHDLKAPLRTVSTFINLIKEQFKEHHTEETDRMFEHVEHATDRMNTLVTDLFNLSVLTDRIQHTNEIAISELTEAAVSFLQSDIARKNASIEVIEDHTIVGYKNALLQILQNLITNAMTYCPDSTHPEIKIRCEDKDFYWQISVGDNGIGIDPKHFGKIFGLFQRLHRWEEFPGSGLGLSLCQRAVEYHQGKIWVESELGKGSTFIFTIKKGLM